MLEARLHTTYNILATVKAVYGYYRISLDFLRFYDELMCSAGHQTAAAGAAYHIMLSDTAAA